MLLKITGMIIVIIACGMLGYSLCDDYIQRIHCVEAMKKALIILRGEIKHNNSSICEALENITVRNNYIIHFLKTVVKEYTVKGISLWEAWENSIIDCFEKKSPLRKEEIRIIKDFGIHLGTTDRETQLKNIDECVNEMEVCILNLKREKKEKCKLYKILGVLSGVFISIILL